MHVMLRNNEKNESEVFDESVENLVWRNSWREQSQMCRK